MRAARRSRGVEDGMGSVHFTRYREFFVLYLAPLWKLVAALGALLLGSTALQLVNPQVVRAFIDTAQAGGATGTLVAIASLFLGIAVVGQVVTVAEQFFAETLGWRATNRLRGDLLRHCLSLDLTFHNAHTPGELIERIDGDVTTLANFFSRFVLHLLGSAAVLVGALLLLWREDWRVGLTLTAMSAITLVLLNVIRPHLARYALATRQASAALFGFLEERLGGILDVQAVGGEAFTLRRLSRLLYGLFHAVRLNVLMSGLMGGATGFFMSLGAVVALGMGAFFYRQGTMSLGTVYLLFQYTAMLRQPLGQISRQARDFQQATASIERVRGLLETPALIQNRAGKELGPGPVGVAYRGVGFAYKAGIAALDDVSFIVPPGTTLGLMGKTGSGKSTLVRLLFRLYDPQAGAVLLNGTDVRDLDLESLRRRVAMVTQEVQIFPASVRDNVTLFDPSFTASQVETVLREIGLRSWLESQPHGLETELASRGGGLSAGQAQLLAFARVFLRDPDVVILDEATSRLDPSTETLVARAIDRLLRPAHGKRRTAIVIAHRPATLRYADKIIVLQDGRLIREQAPLGGLSDADGGLAATLVEPAHREEG